MVTYLILGTTYAFAAAMQPGPYQTFVISQTLSRGWKRALPAAFAPVVSDAPIILLTLFLLSQLRTDFLRFLHLGGGLFLLCLTWRSFKTWQHFHQSGESADTPGHQTLFSAVFVNLLNPNPYIAWSLIMGPLFLKGWHETPANGISLIFSFYVTMTACTMGIILLFAFARKLGPKVNRLALGVSTAALAGFGVYQLWLGASLFLVSVHP